MLTRIFAGDILDICHKAVAHQSFKHSMHSETEPDVCISMFYSTYTCLSLKLPVQHPSGLSVLKYKRCEGNQHHASFSGHVLSEVVAFLALLCNSKHL